MASLEKMAKNLFHEISDGKCAMQAGAANHFRNQEIVIVQNKNIIRLLESIDQKLSQMLCGADDD